MRCLVTGGAGFIGSNLVDRLIEDGHKVQVWDDLSTGNKLNVNPFAYFVNCDIAGNYEARKQLMSEFKPDVIFHLAAKARVQPSIENPIEFHNTNVNGTLNLLNMAVEVGVKRFIFSSSSSVYGDVEQEDLPTTETTELNPMSPYALHKQIGEQYCKLYSKLYGLETASLRYFNVYGERQPTEGAYMLVVPIFMQQRLNNKPMTIRGDGEQKRDFTYVGDVVDANIKVATSKIKWEGDVFNIGNGDNRSVNQIAEMIGGETVNVEPVIEPKETLADNGKAQFILDWKPTVKIEDWMIGYKKDFDLEI